MLAFATHADKDLCFLSRDPQTRVVLHVLCHADCMLLGIGRAGNSIWSILFILRQI